jgi:hypothetical protein
MRTVRDIREFIEGLPDAVPISFHIGPGLLANRTDDVDVIMELQANQAGDRRIVVNIDLADHDEEPDDAD